jgi:hypothetical protein
MRQAIAILLLLLTLSLTAESIELATLPFNEDISNNISDIKARMDRDADIYIEEADFILIGYASCWMQFDGMLYFLVKFNSDLVFAVFAPDTLTSLAELRQKIEKEKLYARARSSEITAMINALAAQRQFRIYDKRGRAQMINVARELSEVIKQRNNGLGFYRYNHYFIALQSEVTIKDEITPGIGFILAKEYLWDLIIQNVG